MPPDTDFTIVQAGRVVALAACILLGYGAYVIWLGVGTGAWFTLLYGATTVVAGASMLAQKTWARFLVYLVVAFFIFAWLLAALIAERSATWEQQSILSKFAYFAPGLGMIAAALACAFVAGRCLAPKGPED